MNYLLWFAPFEKSINAQVHTKASCHDRRQKNNNVCFKLKANCDHLMVYLWIWHFPFSYHHLQALLQVLPLSPRRPLACPPEGGHFHLMEPYNYLPPPPHQRRGVEIHQVFWILWIRISTLTSGRRTKKHPHPMESDQSQGCQ